MTLLGTLLKNRRAGDTHSAWNLPNLQGPELLIVTSEHFMQGESIPLEHAGKRIGGNNLSPHLAWPPPETRTATGGVTRLTKPAQPGLRYGNSACHPRTYNSRG